MSSNIQRYEADLRKLIERGEGIRKGLLVAAYGHEALVKDLLKEFKDDKEKVKDYLKDIPSFGYSYQEWYSEAQQLVKLMLPDRLLDFVGHYQTPKNRKEVDYSNYRIEDALQGLRATLRGEVKVDAKAAVPHLDQQLAIVRAIQARFKSSLFDISAMVQADLFDSELDSARALLKSKYVRAAGAIAGVVLEKHLGQVCVNHSIKVTKKNPGISDLNEALKAANVIDVPQWRFNQHLADVRNLCDHAKTVDPTSEQVHDLIEGVIKVTKSIF